MPNGITVKDVFVARVSRDSIESSLEDAEDMVRHCQQKIRDMVMSTPRSKLEDNYHIDWLDWAGYEYDDLIRELDEHIWKVMILRVAKENIEIYGPKAIECDYDEPEEKQ